MSGDKAIKDATDKKWVNKDTGKPDPRDPDDYVLVWFNNGRPDESQPRSIAFARDNEGNIQKDADGDFISSQRATRNFVSQWAIEKGAYEQLVQDVNAAEKRGDGSEQKLTIEALQEKHGNQVFFNPHAENLELVSQKSAPENKIIEPKNSNLVLEPETNQNQNEKQGALVRHSYNGSYGLEQHFNTMKVAGGYLEELGHGVRPEDLAAFKGALSKLEDAFQKDFSGEEGLNNQSLAAAINEVPDNLRALAVRYTFEVMDQRANHPHYKFDGSLSSQYSQWGDAAAERPTVFNQFVLPQLKQDAFSYDAADIVPQDFTPKGVSMADFKSPALAGKEAEIEQMKKSFQYDESQAIAEVEAEFEEEMEHARKEGALFKKAASAWMGNRVSPEVKDMIDKVGFAPIGKDAGEPTVIKVGREKYGVVQTRDENGGVDFELRSQTEIGNVVDDMYESMVQSGASEDFINGMYLTLQRFGDAIYEAEPMHSFDDIGSIALQDLPVEMKAAVDRTFNKLDEQKIEQYEPAQSYEGPIKSSPQ